MRGTERTSGSGSSRQHLLLLAFLGLGFVVVVVLSIRERRASPHQVNAKIPGGTERPSASKSPEERQRPENNKEESRQESSSNSKLRSDVERVLSILQSTKGRQRSSLESRELFALREYLRAYAWTRPDSFLELLELIAHLKVDPDLVTDFVDGIFGRSDESYQLKEKEFLDRLANLLSTERNPAVLLAASWPICAHASELPPNAIKQILQIIKESGDQRFGNELLVRLVSAMGCYTLQFPELVQQFMGLATDDSRTMRLRLAAVQALGVNALTQESAAASIAALLEKSQPADIRVAAAQAAKPMPFSSAGTSDAASALLINALESALAGEADTQLVAVSAGLLAMYDNDRALAVLKRVISPGLDPAIGQAVADGIYMTEYSSKQRVLLAQELAVDIINYSREAQVQIAAVNAMARLIPKSIYSGDSNELVEPVSGGRYTLDRATLENVSKVLTLLSERGAPEVRTHIAKNVLPDIEESLPFLKENATYQSLKQHYIK